MGRTYDSAAALRVYKATGDLAAAQRAGGHTLRRSVARLLRRHGCIVYGSQGRRTDRPGCSRLEIEFDAAVLCAKGGALVAHDHDGQRCAGTWHYPYAGRCPTCGAAPGLTEPMSAREAARVFGFTFIRFLRAGVGRAGPGRPAEIDLSAALSLRASGLSWEAVAATLGCTDRALRDARRRARSRSPEPQAAPSSTSPA